MLSIAETPPVSQPIVAPLFLCGHLAAAASLVAAIEEKALRREITGQSAPLVCKAISHHTAPPVFGPLPLWAYHPPTGSKAYFRVYHRDVELVRCHPETPPAATVPPPRAAVSEFSRKSRARLAHACNNGGHQVRSQLCLTYHQQSPIDGRAVKKDLDRWLTVLRRLLPGVLYLWVLEFQDRGVPHFHVFLSAPAAPGSELHRRIAAAWVRITQGTPQQEWWHNRPGNWVEWSMTDSKYVLKQYAVKEAQKDVPPHYLNVGRFWGCTRGFVPPPVIAEPETIAPWADSWAPDQIERYFARVLRRFHENSMNRDRKTGQKRPGRRRRSPLAFAGGSLNGAYRIPFAAPLVYQLLDYVAAHPPDIGAVRRATSEVPF